MAATARFNSQSLGRRNILCKMITASPVKVTVMNRYISEEQLIDSVTR